MTPSLPADPSEPVGDRLPPVAPQVVAAVTADLSSRLAKKLDATIERVGAAPRSAGPDGLRIDCGPDAIVTLTPGPSGVITDADQVRCGCLLAPRCLHRAAVLGACPVADPAMLSSSSSSSSSSDDESGAATTIAPNTCSGDTAVSGDPDLSAAGSTKATGAATPSGSAATSTGSAATSTDRARTPNGSVATSTDSVGTAPGGGGTSALGGGVAAPAGTGRAARSGGPTAAQRVAASGLWRAGVAVLAAGVPAAGAVLQAELLRSAHSARLAGLPRAENAALRAVRGLRAARARHDGHRLAELVVVLHEVLLTSGRLAAGDADPALVGVSRRSYRPGGSLRVSGVCREPVISATGYAGVVTHLRCADGRWFSIVDVQPGGPDRARNCANAVVEVGLAAVNHAQLARGGLLITGATVSPDGRLGAGRGVRAIPVDGPSWSTGSPAELFARPLAEAVRAQLGPAPEQAGNGSDVHLGTNIHLGTASDGSAGGPELVGCDLVVLGAAGDHLLARELTPSAAEPVAAAEPAIATGPVIATGRAIATGPVIRLVPADSHPELAHLANLRRLASRPGLRIRVVGRLDTERASTLRPLAVGPVPGAEPTLRLPEQWLDHADLGYDLLQGGHLPPVGEGLPDVPVGQPGPDLVAASPLWRVRRLVELAVAGGRRTVGEAARGDGSGLTAPLRRAGFAVAAALATALGAESDRHGRDSFGRLTDPDPDRYAWAWVAAATHLAATERELVRASWTDPSHV
ncbi:hypothetical protein [Plantactinospora soyae]|uniref:SWIM-type domain-containing protein n=1 Tax=Plantactinospora soyae TaxID=1544732 RepID=A0A927MAE0_9ACTN|nr:hypothetical protein [Plantactinospora soyae]MBE1487435.1 hypothetical protein [Plantactinospora soyae]